MATTVNELARLVGGQVAGDGETAIREVSIPEQVKSGEITLIDSIERLGLLTGSVAAAAVVPEGSTHCGVSYERTIPWIEVSDVHSAFAKVILHFRPRRERDRVGIRPAAFISDSARVADDVEVHAGVTIGRDVEIGSGSTIHAGVQIMDGCRIGQDVTLMPTVVLYENTEIGSRVLIHAHAVLGAYGFGYSQVEGRHERTAQLGNVQIGDDVEIGAGTTIDRGTYGSTTVGAGTKIDNLVMIGHNCRIGRHNMICSQVGIAGSTSTGDYVVMAGQVGIRDHVHIGTGAVLGAMSGVSNHVPDGVRMIGIPATPERDQKLKQAALAKLPEMRKEFKAMKRKIEKLSTQRESDDGQAAA